MRKESKKDGRKGGREEGRKGQKEGFSKRVEEEIRDSLGQNGFMSTSYILSHQLSVLLGNGEHPSLKS